ncbi:MAG: T9SS type A sorting domain-containing protein [Bacteroidetes bacterium]|nr:T9SS type A sorting domain-containing protein [Bacteroidota bacterium]
MKSKILFVASFLIVKLSYSQSPSSFYLSHGNLNECKFSSDAIYFLSTSGILDKTDFNGNTIWSRSLGGQSSMLTLHDAAIYFYSGSALVKMDTAGNFIWGRSLLTPECGTFNNIVGLTTDGENIYVSTNGGMYGMPNGILVYDSAGALTYSSCDQTGNDNYIEQGYPRIGKGAWFLIMDQGTGVSYAWMARMDSTGHFESNIDAINLDFGIYENICDLLPLTDSTYLVINSTSDNFWGWYPTSWKICFSKFREDGSVIWQKSFYSSSAMLTTHAACADSLGNIYILGDKNNDIFTTYFSLKVDSSGNLISANEWNNLPGSFNIPIYVRMKYSNGRIFCPYNNDNHGGVFVIDTLLTPPCGIVQSALQVVAAIPNINHIPWYQYSAVNYLRVDTTISFPAHSVSSSSDLCQVLQTNEGDIESGFQLSPNPAKGRLTLNCSSVSSVSHLEIFNLLGESCLELSDSYFPIQIDIGKLLPGIYFVKIQNERGCHFQKFVVE